MFTDIVDSTAYAVRLGDAAWRTLLDRRDALVRSELARHRGSEVKTLGDGFLAVFDSPSRAVRCATAIRDGARGLGIEVRAGLHTGELERRGSDVAGLAVHVGARIGALAAPSEVLVSRTVRDLVLGSGFSFLDRGVRHLKGIEGEWQLLAAE
jgi:class 3 adenylate cyclase